MRGLPEPSSPGAATAPAEKPASVPPTTAGPVALVGSGEYLDVMADVDRGLLAGRPARAVLVPTAAAEEGPDRVRYWLDLGTRHFTALGVEPVPLPVLTRDDARAGDFAAAVTGAGLVYLSGGNPGYLASVLRDSPVWAAIQAEWRAGAALAGCSAGACALTWVAEDVRAMRAGGSSSAGSDEHSSEALPTVPSGLAAVPELAVIPHFDRMARWAPDLPARYATRVPAGVTVVGIDEDTAVITAGYAAGERLFAVAGRQSAWVLHPDGKRTEHRSGDELRVPCTRT